MATPTAAAPAAAPPPPPRPAAISKVNRSKPPPAVHLVAGGLGGMAGAIVTAPFDVVKTRLQSDLFARVADTSSRTGLRALLWNFVDTGKILRDVYKFEGASALFKGLGPTLAGAVPARSINFFVYGNGKLLYADLFNGGKENTAVHLAAAATAGVATAAATNPIWVVKTDMQLRQQEHKAAKSSSPSSRRPPPPPVPKPHHQVFSHSFRSLSSPPGAMQGPPPRPTSFSTALQIYHAQGLRGFYRGLSASLLGVTEGTIQWSLYEQFKVLARVDASRPDDPAAGASWRTSAAAGSAKLVATVITYPHEVVRTRLRQPIPPGGQARYTSLTQSFRRVLAEEGWRALYGGMSAHLLRVIPNAAAMFYVYETCVGFVARSQAVRLVEENDVVVRE
ncbi:hypothetical protein JCM9279_005686 [Rhodotorula babjevae]